MTISQDAARQALGFCQATPKTGCLKPVKAEQTLATPTRTGSRCGASVATTRTGMTCGTGFSVSISAYTRRPSRRLQAILPADIIGYERFHSLADLKAHGTRLIAVPLGLRYDG